MSYLLKLEMKKIKWKRHIIGIIAAILFSILFLTISLVDSATDPTQTKDTFQSTMVAEALLITTIFLIYASVLTATIIISEYNNRTILILFSYPVNKKQLVGTKLLIIIIFTVVAMILGHVCCISYLIFIDRKFDLIAGTMDTNMFIYYVKMALSNIICCGMLAGVPFCIGMIKKSVPITIVSSIAAVFLRQVFVSSGTIYRESVLQLIIVGIIVAVMLYTTFRYKVEQIESL